MANQAACDGVEGNKAWSCPALAKVGQARRRQLLAVWDVAASKGNAQLQGAGSQHSTGWQAGSQLCCRFKCGEAEPVLALSCFCLLCSQSLHVLSIGPGVPVGLGQAAVW